MWRLIALLCSALLSVSEVGPSPCRCDRNTTSHPILSSNDGPRCCWAICEFRSKRHIGDVSDQSYNQPEINQSCQLLIEKRTWRPEREDVAFKGYRRWSVRGSVCLESDDDDAKRLMVIGCREGNLWIHFFALLLLCVYLCFFFVYIYMCVCVCVCEEFVVGYGVL